jgi:peptidase E
MINVLLSTYDFNNGDCFLKLKDFLKPYMRVCIIPYSHHEDMYEDEELFDKMYNYNNGYELNFIARAYHDYGISRDQIRVINPFRDNKKLIEYKILNSDILFFTGGDPVKAMERMQDIRDILNRFNGIVMGASAGAMVQMQEFVMCGEGYSYGYYKGLGFINIDFEPIVHFEHSDHIFKLMIRSLRERPNHMLVPLKDGKCLIIHSN